MASVKILMSAAAAVTIGSTAFAADMPPPPPIAYQPVVVEQPGAWYLRGDIGVGITNKFEVTYLPSGPDVGNGFQFDQNSNDDTVFIRAGVGYEWNNWLRFDVTGEYRDKTQVNARGVYNPVNGQGDAYQGYLQSWIVLANGYIDLGTWNCLTPFIGAGVGGAYNVMDDLVDTGIGTTGAGFGRNSNHWSPAWAVYAGLDYNVTQNFSMELAYRYLDYGSVTDTIDCIGGCSPDSYKFSKFVSNDIMLGMRWRFPVDSLPFIGAQPAAVVTPAPVYQPPPLPAPPLSTRG